MINLDDIVVIKIGGRDYVASRAVSREMKRLRGAIKLMQMNAARLRLVKQSARKPRPDSRAGDPFAACPTCGQFRHK